MIRKEIEIKVELLIYLNCLLCMNFVTANSFIRSCGRASEPITCEIEIKVNIYLFHINKH